MHHLRHDCELHNDVGEPSTEKKLELAGWLARRAPCAPNRGRLAGELT